MITKAISEEFLFPPNYIEINGAKIHYIDEGSGSDPILFLHEIPASCYSWRNVIPHLSELGRCLAPDLVGFGKSSKPEIDYTINTYIEYLKNFIDRLNLKNITFIMHGWGSVIGCDYAMQHPENCKALIFYEGYLRPVNSQTISLPYQEQIQLLEKLKIETDIMANPIPAVEKMLKLAMLRMLTADELYYYTEPFMQTGSGKALLNYINDLPKGNEDSAVDKIIKHYSQRLMKSALPKLLLYSLPGFTTMIETVIWAREHFPNLEISDIEEALHYAQEVNPRLMGETMSIWLQGLEP